MSGTLEAAIRDLLRSSEELEVILEAEAVPRPSDTDSSSSSSTSTSSSSDSESDSDAGPPGGFAAKKRRRGAQVDRKRVLAVVEHVDPYGEEQGCVFVCKPHRKEADTGTITEQYSVEHAFPILSGFTIAMAQARRNTLDLSSASTAALTQQKSADFTLTLHPGHDLSQRSIAFTIQDTPRLKSFLGEVKRLKDISVANSEPGTTPSYSWILPYISDTKPSILSAEPQDLRNAHKPMTELLSEASAGSPGNDALDTSIIREYWIRSRVQELYDSSEQASLKLRIGTFNVNGKLPSQDLSAWVRGMSTEDANKYLPPLKQLSPFALEGITKDPMEEAPALRAEPDIAASGAASESSDAPVAAPPSGEDDDPDLIVLGFQELDLSASALLYSTETTREDAWLAAAMAGLGEKAVEYEKLASKQLVGMLLLVLAKRTLKDCFTAVQTASVGAGLMGLMGNKGAVGVRLAFAPRATGAARTPRPATLTFVNAHLAAFDEQVERRNADFHDIARRLVFGGAGAAGPAPGAPGAHIWQSDALFWLGDLNYRNELPDADVRALLADDAVDNVPALLEFDQLNIARRTDRAFANFIEHPISHLPSYRFSPGALCDNLGYDLKRKPAWTDRILYIPSVTAGVQQRTYRCHKEITMSDHRPVSATFDLRIPTIDGPQLEARVQGLWKAVSHIEDAEDIPRVSVEPAAIDLGKIEYNHPTRRSVVVRNTGRVPLAYRFVAHAPRGPICPSWLHADPPAGLVRPGEHEEIALTASVDARAAAELNTGPARLEATLVLHVARGKDSFLVVSGDYVRTCFATSIQRLVRLPGPIRTADPGRLLPDDQAATAPREVMRLVSWLMSHGTDVDDLFLAPGAPAQALDTGAELPEPGAARRALALSVAACLLQLLAALPEPLVPPHLQHACAEAADREAAFELLNGFPGANVNVWIALTSLLHFLCQQETGTPGAVRVRQLAAKFAPVLLRDDPASAKAISPLAKRRFIMHFVA
ncbi:DNase I-like protein [Phanerochaete sordida]|uniref:DNase I-like protein n=1 Tax=Phanerochaete sordida TaxID=48140 RepID=A0A9P3LF04_9APHY|nr:DNase I-like protein [Phanerochaete sordida]